MESPDVDFEKMHDDEAKKETVKRKMNESLACFLKKTFGNINIEGEYEGSPLPMCAMLLFIYTSGVLAVGLFYSIVMMFVGTYIGSSGIDVDYNQVISRTTIVYCAISFSLLACYVIFWVVVRIAHKEDLYSSEYKEHICWIVSLLPGHVITGISVNTLLVSYCLHIAISHVGSKTFISGLGIHSPHLKHFLNKALTIMEGLAIYHVALQKIGGFDDVPDLELTVFMLFGVFSMNWAVPALPYIFPNAFHSTT